MEHTDLFRLRETYNSQQMMLCFNGPFSQGLIEEIGSALRRYMEAETENSSASASAARDVFAVYIEITQNIRHYCQSREYNDTDASATVVIGRDVAGHYVISAGNIVENADADAVIEKVNSLAQLDKAQLKAAYKEQMRRPVEHDGKSGAGLGLIDIARKASEPVSCSLHPMESKTQSFFSLCVVI